MKRFVLFGFLLLTPFLSLGCGSSNSGPDPSSAEAQTQIDANDAAVDAEESAQ